MDIDTLTRTRDEYLAAGYCLFENRETRTHDLVLDAFLKARADWDNASLAFMMAVPPHDAPRLQVALVQVNDLFRPIESLVEYLYAVDVADMEIGNNPFVALDTPLVDVEKVRKAYAAVTSGIGARARGWRKERRDIFIVALLFRLRRLKVDKPMTAAGSHAEQAAGILGIERRVVEKAWSNRPSVPKRQRQFRLIP